MRAILGLKHALLAVALALGLSGNSTTAQTLLPLPARIEVVGVVRAIAVQADGKTVVGGSFSSINGVSRQNIGRLNTDGSVDPSWDPGVGSSYGEVYALCVTSNAILVGGSFTTMGGTARRYLAAVDITDGTATNWDPQASDYVYALALAGNTVYVGGSSYGIGGQPRSGLAALDLTTALATPWNPVSNGSAEAIAIVGNTIYAGGGFNSMGGQARSRLAAVDATTAAVLPWNPGADDHVLSLAVSGNTVYAGGDFHHAGGLARSRLAAIDAASGMATAWNPDPDNRVSAILLTSDRIYVGGTFVAIGGQLRRSLAGLDPTSGLATTWDSGGDGGVAALALSGDTLLVGGGFGNVAGARRAGIAAIDVTNFVALPLPRAIGKSVVGTPAVVRTSVVDAQGRLIIGGEFDVADGFPRRSIARYLADGSIDSSWEPETNGGVVALAVLGNTVYAGGGFFVAGGQPRNNLAAFDATSGQVTSWNPDANGPITAMAAAGNKIYVAGAFGPIGGQSRQGFAILDATTGQSLPSSAAAADVSSIVASGNRVYVGGAFALDTNTDAMTGWHPIPFPGEVTSMAVSGTTVYLGGFFIDVGGVPRNHIAAVDATLGHPTNWNPGSNQDVTALAVAGNVVYVGSESGSVGVSSHIVALDATTGAMVPNFDATPNAGPQTLSVWGAKIFAGGYFLAVNGQSRSLAAAFLAPGLSPPKVSVVEYHHAAFDHYFMTPIAAEIALLDAHVPPFQDWSRTGKSFNAYANTTAPIGSVATCRFFNDHFAPKSSHFYAAHGYGCEATLALFPDWGLEDDQLFNTFLPSAAGICPTGTVPIYRVYNQGQGGAPNHRFVTTQADVQLMVSRGFVSEGVVMCVPP